MWKNATIYSLQKTVSISGYHLCLFPSKTLFRIRTLNAVLRSIRDSGETNPIPPTFVKMEEMKQK